MRARFGDELVYAVLPKPSAVRDMRLLVPRHEVKLDWFAPCVCSRPLPEWCKWPSGEAWHLTGAKCERAALCHLFIAWVRFKLCFFQTL